jgi:hypothetical protein
MEEKTKDILIDIVIVLAIIGLAIEIWYFVVG